MVEAAFSVIWWELGPMIVYCFIGAPNHTYILILFHCQVPH